jgi:hypothetical protein
MSKTSIKHMHCTENRIYVFPKRKYAASVPIPTYMCLVSDLYIPAIGLPILPQENMWTDPRNI